MRSNLEMTSDSVLLTQQRSKLGTQVIHLFPPHYSQSICISKWPVRIIYSPMGFHVTVPLRIYREPKGNVYALVLVWNPRFYMSNNLPDDINAAACWATFWLAVLYIALHQGNAKLLYSEPSRLAKKWQ